MSWNCTPRSFEYLGQVGSLMRVVKLSSSSSWTAAAVPKIKARLRLPTSTMKPPPQKLASNLCLHPFLSVGRYPYFLLFFKNFWGENHTIILTCSNRSNSFFFVKLYFQKGVENRQLRPRPTLFTYQSDEVMILFLSKDLCTYYFKQCQK